MKVASGENAAEGPELAVVLARHQNSFFVELAEALIHELRALGIRTSLRVNEIPEARADLVYVFLPPHEYAVLTGHRPSRDILQRSILISAEQPSSPFFEGDVHMAVEAGAVFDINPRAVRAYRDRGIGASHLQLGHTDLWDRFEQDERDIDVLFMGRFTERRAVALSTYADVLEPFRCHLLLSDNSRPNTEPSTTFAASEAKRDLLARTKVVLNIHGEDEPYFEWLRATEVMCAGCALVSERSTDLEPLRPGRHLLVGRLASLGHLCALLLEDASRREHIREEGYGLLRDEHPLRAAARRLADAAADIAQRPLRYEAVARIRLEGARRRTPSFDAKAPLQPPRRLSGVSDGEAMALRALKNQQLAIAAIRRDLQDLRRMVAQGTNEPARTTLVVESQAWREGGSRALTVVTPLYNHAETIREALDSLLECDCEDWEVVVVDDGSSDGGGEVVREWIEAHPDRAARLVRHEVNRGLSAARNTGVEHGRADRLLMLDADNQVRRLGIGRLMQALDGDERASFAYGIIERFDEDGPCGLVSAMGWMPERFRAGNYVDAFALIRRSTLEEMGGYDTADPRLYGWEDYDLWVRIAEAGHHGVFVPEFIGRYRVSHGSMISHTNLSVSDAFAALVDHAPALMAGLEIPG